MFIESFLERLSRFADIKCIPISHIIFLMYYWVFESRVFECMISVVTEKAEIVPDCYYAENIFCKIFSVFEQFVAVT